jgi:hypothetical protein
MPPRRIGRRGKPIQRAAQRGELIVHLQDSLFGAVLSSVRGRILAADDWEPVHDSGHVVAGQAVLVEKWERPARRGAALAPRRSSGKRSRHRVPVGAALRVGLWRLNGALRQHLIVLDELGFIPFSATGAHLIFQFCSTLYQRVSLIITTNLRFADWAQVFGDECLTAALLDRLSHKAHILEFSGAESYRFRERLQREREEGVQA